MEKGGTSPKSHTKAKNITDALVIKEMDLTLITQPTGDVPAVNNYGYGLYHRDCRFLSGYITRINGVLPTSILSSGEKGYRSVVMLANPEMTCADGTPIGNNTISIRRDRSIAGEIREIVLVENFNEFTIPIDLSFEFQADFMDIFAIRGIAPGASGVHQPARFDQGTLTLEYLGKDQHTRITSISLSPSPSRVEGSTCHFDFSLQPHTVQVINIVIEAHDIPPGGHLKPAKSTFKQRLKGVEASHVEATKCCSNVWTNNSIFNKVFMQSLSDLRMLYMLKKGDVYYSAGVPWYDALFGRDSLISSLQVIPYNPGISKSTLLLLASYQGNKVDDWRDEQPGKILHELRVGEDANLNVIPQNPYYGSVDSTPLFLILVAEHIDWTGDMGLFHRLRSNIDRALAWIGSSTNKDGFLVYEEKSSRGIYNQGWKDSFDSVSRSDGTLAKAPVALSEVQGYVYMAKKRMANLYDRIDEADGAKELRKEAASLYWNFNEKFWMPEKNYYAEALDALGQCDVISSNPGQALWGEIVERSKLDGMLRRLFDPDMYAGWGIRTLRSEEVRFNPLGYHNGTVWPHDNSIIAMGLKKYDRHEEMIRLFTSMFEAAGFYTSYRLPELFGGFHRAQYDVPIKYPVACSPQAWSSGTIPYMLTASLGMFPDALHQKLTLRQPRLPPWLESLRIDSLNVGDARVKLEFNRIGGTTMVNVAEKQGTLEVEVLY